MYKRQACDISTGVDSNSGQVDLNAIKANYTIAMGYPKIGSLIEPGKSFSGLITSVDIGFPKKIKELNGTKWKIVTDKYIKKTLKPLKRDTHKYKQGKVLILAGSDGMTGAAYLSTMGALRSGCGITKTFAPASLKNIYEKKITEGMTIACNDKDLGYFTTRNYSQITEHIDWADAVLIGPGLGTNSETVKLLKMLYRSINKPMVIDADGFSAFYKDRALIKRLKSKCVLTPHAGELSNLLNVPSEVIKKDLIRSIEKITQSGVGVLVAKGAPSLISNGKYGFINSTGNPGLATAGSGDILSGIITSFIAQGYKLIEATVISCYIHGYAADIKSKEISERGIIASDLLVDIGKKLADYERINGNTKETISILHDAYKEAIFSDEYFMRAMEASIFISYIVTQTKKMKIETPRLELESDKLHIVALAVQGRIDSITSRIPQTNSNIELKEFLDRIKKLRVRTNG